MSHKGKKQTITIEFLTKKQEQRSKTFSLDFVRNIAYLLPLEQNGDIMAAEKFISALLHAAPIVQSAKEEVILIEIRKIARDEQMKVDVVSKKLKKAIHQLNIKRGLSTVTTISKKLGYKRSSTFPDSANYNGSPIISIPMGGKPREE